MAKRPSFQFYPADWRNNAKLRRCSDAARGAWMDVLCILHDSDEYGVCRWPLADLARAAGVPLKLVKELADKDVLKGADKNATPYVYVPRHAGKDGEPVTLVTSEGGPCWYCSRFVRDEWVRQRRGQSSQFSSDNQPPKPEPKTTPKSSPKGGIGERQGDGSTSTSSSTPKPSAPDGAGGEPPKTAEQMAKDELWAAGKSLLEQGGMPRAQCGSFVGRLVKDYTADVVMDAVRRAVVERPADPVSFLKATCQFIAGERKPTNRQDALEQANSDIAARVAAEIEGAAQ